jgi:hypothetical protein
MASLGVQLSKHGLKQETPCTAATCLALHGMSVLVRAARILEY